MTDQPHQPAGTTAPYTVYLAAEGFEAELAHELGSLRFAHGRLMAADGPPRPAAWAQNIWYEPAEIRVRSIKDAARTLRAIQRNWALHPIGHQGRARLIESLLPPVSARPLTFPAPAPVAPLGSWTLLEPEILLASGHCASPFRHGEATFVEDRAAPPNRAYLKLWEALTLAGELPGPGSRCLDLGASPGGWTWVLAGLGATVTSIDKADLAPAVAALPGVTVRRESAFGLDPADIGPVDWLFSDVICYPERLLRLVERWLASGLARRFVCTLKFQGETDHATARRFAEIPGSRLIHLHHNKHELTWIKL